MRSAIVAMSVATSEDYGANWKLTFGESGADVGMQAAALGSTIAIALVGGALTGLLIRWKGCGAPTQYEAYDDHKWSVD